MKNVHTILFLILSALIIACNPDKEGQGNEHEKSKKITYTNSLVPINYDFDGLQLHMNSSVKDTNSKVEWRWDYMNSDNSEPDSIGKDSYFWLAYETFWFDGEESLPRLSVQTLNNKIVSFSAVTISYMKDTSDATKSRLLDSLRKYELLGFGDCNDSLIQSGRYSKPQKTHTESFHLDFDPMPKSDSLYYMEFEYTMKLRGL